MTDLAFFVVLFIFFQPTWYVYRAPLIFNESSFFINFFRTLSAIAGCGVFLCICKYLHYYLDKYTTILHIGQATLALYVLQTMLFFKYEEISLFLPEITTYSRAFILSLVILFVLYVIYCIMRKIPFIAWFLFGEKIKRLDKVNSSVEDYS